jgi:hypothetical protein
MLTGAPPIWGDGAEHALDVLDVRRDRAVAAEQTMPPEQPQISRLRHRMLGHRRRVVGVRQPLGPLGQQILQLKIAEPGKRQIKAAELQLAQLEPQQLRVPRARARAEGGEVWALLRAASFRSAARRGGTCPPNAMPRR